MTDQQQALIRHRRYQLHKARQALKGARGNKAAQVEVSWAQHRLWTAEQEAA